MQCKGNLLPCCSLASSLGDLPGRSFEQRHHPCGHKYTRGTYRTPQPLSTKSWWRQGAQPNSITSNQKPTKSSYFTMKQWLPCWLMSQLLFYLFSTHKIPGEIWGSWTEIKGLRTRAMSTWPLSLSHSFWIAEATFRPFFWGEVREHGGDWQMDHGE